MKACVFVKAELCNEAVRKYCSIDNKFEKEYLKNFEGITFVIYVEDNCFRGYDFAHIVGNSYKQIYAYYYDKYYNSSYFSLGIPIQGDDIKNIYYSRQTMETE